MAKTVEFNDVKSPRRLLFRGMAHLDADAVRDHSKPVVALPVDGLLATIFAPDRRTGMPGNALSVNLGESYDPATKEYIRQKLLGVNPDPVIGHDDPGVVMAAARLGGESVDDYVTRLSRVVESYYKKDD